MPASRSLLDSIMASSVPEEMSAISVLFDTKNYQRLKMTSEISPTIMHGSILLGVIQRRFKSKVLKLFDEELLTRQKSRDRQGIMELIEVLLGSRKLMGEED